MITTVGQFIAGVVAATLIAALFYAVGTRRALWLNATSLVITGLLYVLFAVVGGELAALPVEIAGALMMAGFAWIGVLRRSPAVLAAGWALHPVWDVALHTRGLGTYAPDGYVTFCAALDFVLAGLVMLLATRSRARLAAGIA